MNQLSVLRKLLYIGLPLLILGGVAIFVIENSQLPLSTQEKRYGGVYRIAIPRYPDEMDPTRADWPISMQLMQALHATLVRTDANGDIVPHLATDWEVDPTKTQYRFRIRQNAFFHNGRTVTVDDVIGSLYRVLRPQSLFRDNFRMVVGYEEFIKGTAKYVQGIRKLSEDTFLIELKYPFVPFLTMLSSINFAILPIHEIESSLDFFRVPIGAGAFRWKPSYEQNTILLESFEGYFLGRPFVDMVHFHVIEDARKREEVLYRGEVEQVYAASENSESNNSNQYTLVPIPETRIYTFGFNTARPPFNDIRVRQAFQYALDVSPVHQQLRAYPNLRPTHGFIPKGLLGYDPDIRPFAHDLDKAKLLLLKAGVKSAGKPPTITFATKLPKPAGEFIIRAVQQACDALGFKVHIDEQWTDFEKDLSNSVGPDIFFIAWAPNFPDPFFLLNYFHSASIGLTNRAHFDDSQYDNLLDASTLVEDPGERVALIKNINRYLIDNAVIIPIYEGSTHSGIFQKQLRGLEFPYANLPAPLLEKVWFGS